jgi:GAF domain-containing protein/nitrogen-specific signal transduction histidine kinase
MTATRPDAAAAPRPAADELERRLKESLAERDEARAQQAATAEVLQIINRTSGDSTPAFKAILERAMRLCDAAFGGLLVLDGEFIKYLAFHNVPELFANFLTHQPVRPQTMFGPEWKTGTLINIADLSQSEAYRRRIPVTVSAVENGGIRATLLVPMLNDGVFIGAFTIYRQENRPFTDRQTALAQTFAAQAAIAIENVRLLTELRESLEQQEAIAELLQVINASPGNLAPVYDVILEKAHTLCGAAQGSMQLWDGQELHTVAVSGPSQYAVGGRRSLDGPNDLSGRLVAGESFVHVADVREVDDPTCRRASATGTRSVVLVPLRKESTLLGIIVAARRAVLPFTDKQIALLQSFAAQAVIAMDNARLLGELRARTDDLQESLEYQTATSDVLKVISRSTFDLQPVLDTLVGTAGRLCNSDSGGMTIRDGEVFRYVANYNQASPFWELLRTRTFVPGRDTVAGRVALDGKVVHIADIAVEPDYNLPETATLGKIRTLLGVPLLREGTVVGTLSLSRRRVEPFTDRQIELVRTFADQAVIAIENARLLTELRARTDDLQESLEYQTATSDVLKVISRSTFDLQPVLQYVLDTAMRLCRAPQGSIFRLEGDIYRWAVGAGLDPAYEEVERNNVIAPGEGTIVGRAAQQRRTVQIVDAWNDPLYTVKDEARLTMARTMLGVPLLREGMPIGVIAMARKVVEPFKDREIELVTTFADQAVIAIENARLLTELRESLDRQTAMSEVLGVISASPGQVQPVFEKMLECAIRLCRAHMGITQRVTDGAFTTVAKVGAPPGFSFQLENYRPPPNTPLAQLLTTKSTIRIDDYRATEGYANRNPAIVALVDQGRSRSAMQVPMVKDGEVVAAMTIYRPEVHPFDDREATIAEDFAKQAVIAIDNARLLTELRESLEQQQAMAEVLQVINASPGNLAPVYDAILDKAHTLCGADYGNMQLWDGEESHVVAVNGQSTFAVGQRRRLEGPNELVRRLIAGESFVHVADVREVDDPIARRTAAGGARSVVLVPLRKESTLLGTIAAVRTEVRPFTDKQIALLQSFAAQAVIAIDNARLLNEIRQRQAELRVTFDNMGDAVIMFDAQQGLVAWNRNFLHMLDIPEEWPTTPRTYGDFAAYLTRRGEFGDQPAPALGATDQGEVKATRYERTRPNGRVLEVRRNPIPGDGGFVFIYSDITERKRAEASLNAAREAAESALAELKAAQANLIQAEKMASLGQLTAGIAHEIKNPLNFVNNFANLSNELLGELKETAAPAFATLDEGKRAEIDETMTMLTGNLEKIQEHGRRADGIVKSMLAHSRGGSGDRREADINALVEESLNLAYHGARAQDQNFNITLERDYDKTVAPIELVPQDITRVFLNLCGNGFYAANKRRRDGGAADYRPVLKVVTRDLGDAVEVRIRDNGAGIPPEIKDRLFQPFFTTKPTGEGTGLGLSISYDIVTQQHGGTIAVDSRVGDFTEFTIRLPRKR